MNTKPQHSQICFFLCELDEVRPSEQSGKCLNFMWLSWRTKTIFKSFSALKNICEHLLPTYETSGGGPNTEDVGSVII